MSTEQSENQVIPTEDFEAAIAECRADPALDHYFQNAPAGARLYIGLTFYTTVFADTLDEALVESCLREIEPDLTLRDVEYLLAHSPTADDKTYLANLLRRLKGQQIGEATEVPKVTLRRPKPVCNPDAETDDIPDLPPEEMEPPPPRRVRSEYEQQMLEARRERWVKGLAKFLLLVVVLGIGLVGWVYLKDHRHVEEQLTETVKTVVQSVKQQTVVPTRSEALENAAAARAEAEKKRREELERKRREQEEKRVAERMAREKALQEQREAQMKIQNARKHYQDVLGEFRNGEADFMQNVRKEDRFDMAKKGDLFQCLLPVESEGFAIYELMFAEKGEEPVVTRLANDGFVTNVSFETFAQMAAKTPHLLKKGRRVYFSSVDREKTETYPAPDGEHDFNPFREEYGLLYDEAKSLGIRQSSMAFDVYFQPKNADSELKVMTLRFGDELSQFELSSRVETWLARMKVARKAKSLKKVKRTVVLTDGDMIRKRLDGVTEVPRTFIFNGSNKHRYDDWGWRGRHYYSEVRKEEIARAKWQKLYDEAVRQERMAEERLQSVQVSSTNVDPELVTSTVREGRLVYRHVLR